MAKHNRRRESILIRNVHYNSILPIPESDMWSGPIVDARHEAKCKEEELERAHKQYNLAFGIIKVYTRLVKSWTAEPAKLVEEMIAACTWKGLFMSEIYWTTEAPKHLKFPQARYYHDLSTVNLHYK